MSTLDLHGKRHVDIDRITENFILLNKCPLKVITGNSSKMVVMTEEAISVKMDYEQSGSNMDSGSVVEIHQNSPLLFDEKEKLGDIAFNIKRKEK